MDTTIAIKPAVGVVDTSLTRADPSPVQQTVRTDLPAEKTVTAVAKTSAVQQTSPETLSRQYIVDPQMREVIYRVMDTRTRQVVWQVPDQALLRSRAYSRTARLQAYDEAISDGEGPVHAQRRAERVV
jgi:broad specificity phosphatase PhoE